MTRSLIAATIVHDSLPGTHEDNGRPGATLAISGRRHPELRVRKWLVRGETSAYRWRMDQDSPRLYAALTARDRRFDGVFFVGVTSTDVYCRPICPARTPRHAHCRFFDSAQ